jgi:Tfp pilus assembly protein PilV
MRNRDLQKGSTLVEALLALTFVIIIITAVVISVITSLSSTDFTKNQNLATQYAQEGLDIARYMRDNNYTVFRALPSNRLYCANIETSSIENGGSCNIVIDNFRRQVYLNHNGDAQGGANRCTNATYVASIVSWADGKCRSETDFCHKVQLDGCLYDINRVPNP